MKTVTKALLGGAAIAVVGAVGGGAFYANNTVIPERIAAEMNASYSDAYDQNKVSDDIKVSRSGDITVKQTGFLKYTATMPSITVETTTKGVTAKTVVQSAEYDLTLNDKVGTFAAAVAGELNLKSDKKINASLQSTGPVTFTTAFALTEQGLNDFNAVVKGSCETVNGNAVLAGGRYNLKTTAANCTLNGEAGDSVGREKITFTSNATFQSDIANNGDDIFTGNEQITMTDMKFAEFSGGKEQGSILIDQIDIETSYDGKIAATGTELGDLSEIFKVLPENIKFNFDVKGLKPQMQGLPIKPDISFGISLGVEGTQKDNATIYTSFNYDVKDLEGADMFVPNINTMPTTLSLEATLGNVPMQKLSNILREVANATDGTMTPDQLLGDDAILKAMREAGVSVKLDFKASSGEIYKSSVAADHKISGDAFPGDGKLELYGYEQAMQVLDMLLGPQQAQSLNGTFIQLAQPTKDGKGVQWEYNLDEQSVLTVNGIPLGKLFGQDVKPNIAPAP